MGGGCARRPQQANGCDCAIMALTLCEILAQGDEPSSSAGPPPRLPASLARSVTRMRSDVMEVLVYFLWVSYLLKEQQQDRCDEEEAR